MKTNSAMMPSRKGFPFSVAHHLVPGKVGGRIARTCNPVDGASRLPDRCRLPHIYPIKTLGIFKTVLNISDNRIWSSICSSHISVGKWQPVFVPWCCGLSCIDCEELEAGLSAPSLKRTGGTFSVIRRFSGVAFRLRFLSEDSPLFLLGLREGCSLFCERRGCLNGRRGSPTLMVSSSSSSSSSPSISQDSSSRYISPACLTYTTAPSLTCHHFNHFHQT